METAQVSLGPVRSLRDWKLPTFVLSLGILPYVTMVLTEKYEPHIGLFDRVQGVTSGWWFDEGAILASRIFIGLAVALTVRAWIRGHHLWFTFVPAAIFLSGDVITAFDDVAEVQCDPGLVVVTALWVWVLAFLTRAWLRCRMT
tara:strand:- start:9857 stop:10288 length:432 start_codon:yes stop_codon:yes gene_type:complete